VNPSRPKPKRRKRRKNPVVAAKPKRRKRANPSRRYKERTKDAAMAIGVASLGGILAGTASEQVDKWIPAPEEGESFLDGTVGEPRFWGGGLIIWGATAAARVARLTNAPEARDGLAGAAGAAADRAVLTLRTYMAYQKAKEETEETEPGRIAPRRLLRARAAAADAGMGYARRRIGQQVGPRRLQVAGDLDEGLDVHPRRLQVAGSLKGGLDVSSGWDVAGRSRLNSPALDALNKLA